MFLFRNKIIAPKYNETTCNSLKVCRSTASPNFVEMSALDTIVSVIFINVLINNTKLQFFSLKYIHNQEEVLSGDDTIFIVLGGKDIIEATIKLEEIITDDELQSLKPKSRKCLFYNEPQSKYFDVIQKVKFN